MRTGRTPLRSTRSRRSPAAARRRRSCSRWRRARVSCPQPGVGARGRAPRGPRRRPARGAADRGRGHRARRRRAPPRSTPRAGATRSSSSSSPARARLRGSRAGATDDTVPPAVAAALSAEHAELAPDARALLEAAAVVGDPFAPELAAAVRSCRSRRRWRARRAAAGGLVRPAGAPRRFAFRHPIAHHAVYVATPGGWRLGAHARAAEALQRRGAGAVQRAHHVEHAAHPGDEDAIALLSDAAAELQSPGARGRGPLLRRRAAPARRRAGRAARRTGSSSRSPTRRPRPATPPPHTRCVDALQRSGPASGWRSPSRWPTRSGGSAATRTRAGGCRSCSANCPRSRRRTASGCGSRSRSRRCSPATSTRGARRPAMRGRRRGDRRSRVRAAALAADAVLSASAADADAPDRVEESAAALDRLTRQWRPGCRRSGCTRGPAACSAGRGRARGPASAVRRSPSARDASGS